MWMDGWRLLLLMKMGFEGKAGGDGRWATFCNWREVQRVLLLIAGTKLIGLCSFP